MYESSSAGTAARTAAPGSMPMLRGVAGWVAVAGPLSATVAGWEALPHAAAPNIATAARHDATVARDRPGRTPAECTMHSTVSDGVDRGRSGDMIRQAGACGAPSQLRGGVQIRPSRR